MAFTYKIDKKENIAEIHMQGELMEKNQANDLLIEAEELSNSGCSKWAIDLNELNFMNSNGLNTLIQLLTKARKNGGEAVIYNLNKKIKELILITKLNTLFKVVENEAEAMKILE
ncbi:MAG: STAS domain-containing protein [Bacteroidia bacterium]